MSHIVVLSSVYLGKASTNGLCAQNIVNALRTLGNDVDIICYEDINAPMDVSTYTFSEIVSYPHSPKRIRNTLKKCFWIMTYNPKCFLNIRKVSLYYDTLLRINSEKRIDAVIAMFFPLETAEALRLFKINYPSVCSVIYELDSISDGVAQNYSIQMLLKNSYRKWLHSVYRMVDDIIVMKSHSDYWDRIFGLIFSGKKYIADIPVLLPRQMRSNNSNALLFVYAGLIDKKYRSPDYLLSVIKALKNKINFSFYFYSKGDCENVISEVARQNSEIRQMGYVPKSELELALETSSILVSIGNSSSKSVPSKLVSYMSYKKPIIHFSSQENDICQEYLNKYPLAIIINQNNSIEESCEQILSFIDKVKNSTIDVDLEKIFTLNTPDYSAKLINSIIGNFCDVIK